MTRLMLMVTVVVLGAAGAALAQTSRYTVTVARQPTQHGFEKLHVEKAAWDPPRSCSGPTRRSIRPARR